MSPRTMSDASTQLKRLAVAIPTLENGEPHELADLAKKLRVDVETLRQDLFDLVTRYEDGPPGFLDPFQVFIDSERARVVAPNLRRPFGLTHSELRALQLGLALLRREVAPDELSILGEVEKKIKKAAMAAKPEYGGVSSRSGRPAEVEPDVFSALRDAIRAKCKVSFAYQGANDTEPSRRTVNPYGTVNARGRWYLVAFCDKATALRVFRIDRISAPRVLEATPSMVAEGFSLQSVIDHGRVMIGDPPATMRVRYSKSIAHWIAEHEQGERQKDGSLIVEHPLADERWAVQHVLQYGPEAEVLSPDSVRKEVAERVRAIVKK